MWIVYVQETGMEVNTFEHYKDADNAVRFLNNQSDMENPFGFIFTKRWEER